MEWPITPSSSLLTQAYRSMLTQNNKLWANQYCSLPQRCQPNYKRISKRRMSLAQVIQRELSTRSNQAWPLHLTLWRKLIQLYPSRIQLSLWWDHSEPQLRISKSSATLPSATSLETIIASGRITASAVKTGQEAAASAFALITAIRGLLSPETTRATWRMQRNSQPVLLAPKSWRKTLKPTFWLQES